MHNLSGWAAQGPLRLPGGFLAGNCDILKKFDGGSRRAELINRDKKSPIDFRAKGTMVLVAGVGVSAVDGTWFWTAPDKWCGRRNGKDRQ